MRLRTIFLFTLISFFLTAAFAETILFKSGKTIEGKITERNTKSITVDFQGIPITYYNDEIESIDGQKISSKASKTIMKQAEDFVNPSYSARNAKQVLEMLKQERYDEVGKKLNEWSSSNPEDKDMIEPLRGLNNLLKNEPSKEKRAMIVASSEWKQTEGDVKDMVSVGPLLNTGGLLEAIDKGDVNELNKLLAQGVNPNDDLLFPILPEAVRKGNVAILKALLDKGANIEAPDKMNGDTPLMVAVWRGNRPAVEFLLKSGAQVNAKHAITNETALNLALTKKNEEIIKILKDAGGIASHDVKPWPKKFYKSGNINKDLLDAVYEKDSIKVKEFIQKGADANSPGPFNMTPLFLAISMGSEEIVKILLEAGSNPNYLGESGPPLSLAIDKHNIKIVDMLIEHGANVKQQLGEELTPFLIVACEHGDLAIVRIFA